MYTPDFLIVKRINNEIHRVVIVETKGDVFAPRFLDKRRFMDTYFVEQNNKEFGYERFEFLFLDDALTEGERLAQTSKKIKEFFREDTVYA